MMQKKIMYFAIPFMFLSSIMFLKKNEIIYQKYEIFNYRSLYKYFLIDIEYAVENMLLYVIKDEYDYCFDEEKYWLKDIAIKGHFENSFTI